MNILQWNAVIIYRKWHSRTSRFCLISPFFSHFLLKTFIYLPDNWQNIPPWKSCILHISAFLPPTGACYIFARSMAMFYEMFYGVFATLSVWLIVSSQDPPPLQTAAQTLSTHWKNKSLHICKSLKLLWILSELMSSGQRRAIYSLSTGKWKVEKNWSKRLMKTNEVCQWSWVAVCGCRQ